MVQCFGVCGFLGGKTDNDFRYTKAYYTANHESIYQEAIGKGDVIVLCNRVLWTDVPKHLMIVSSFDVLEKDYLCAGHDQERQAYPLLEAVAGYDVVKILCF